MWGAHCPKNILGKEKPVRVTFEGDAMVLYVSIFFAGQYLRVFEQMPCSYILVLLRSLQPRPTRFC